MRGFAILLLLLGLWFTTMFMSASVSRASNTDGRTLHDLCLTMGSGGITGRWYTMVAAKVHPAAKGSWWDARVWHSEGLEMLPRFRISPPDGAYQVQISRSLFIPLWVPLAAWIFLWPWLMHRSDEKEARIYGGPPRGPEDGDGITSPLPSSAPPEPGHLR